MKNLQVMIIMTLFTTGTLFWGCDSLIYNDLKDCPQGVYVKFYSKTLCADDSLFIGKVSSLTIFAFDQKGILNTSVEQENVDLTRDFEVLVPVSDGNYSFIAWTGVNNNFKKNTFNPGVTSKQDVMLTINSVSNIATKMNPTDCIWHGESPVVFLPDPAEYGSLYKHTAVNLRELTNRVRVIVEFDQKTMVDYDPTKLEISVSSANGTINIDGRTPSDIPELTYPSIETKFEENTSSWYYSMLDLTTGHSSTLNITYNGNGKKETVYSGDLITSILLKASEEGIKLECENNFTIKFLVKSYCAECWTHFNSTIYVNDWVIYSYSTDL